MEGCRSLHDMLTQLEEEARENLLFRMDDKITQEEAPSCSASYTVTTEVLCGCEVQGTVFGAVQDARPFRLCDG